MEKLDISELCYSDVDVEIIDIFPEKWTQKKDFCMYQIQARPCSALFFVLTDVRAFFHPLGGEIVSAKKGDIVFIPQGICYRACVEGTANSKTDTYTINFNIFDTSREGILLSEKISVLGEAQSTVLDSRLKSLYNVFYRIEKSPVGDVRSIVRAKGEFFLLLDLISESLSSNNEFFYPIRKGIRALCDEWNQNCKIEKYAEICGISSTYFYRCFKKWSGCSPVEYRNMLRLSNAQGLLRSTDMKILEISQSIGFEDPFYFCRLFSKRFGLSPRDYRIQHRRQRE